LIAVAPDNAAQSLSPDLLPLPVASVKDGFRTRWYRSRSFVAGIVILGVIIGMCTLAPLLTPFSPTQQDLTHVLQPPSAQHLLGTDQLGIDMWSQLLYGGRTDLRIAFLAVILPFIIGTTLGCLAGYYGRAVDVGVMRMVDIVVAFPFYVLVIALVFAIGPGEKGIYIAITIVGWVSYARIVRGEILVAKQQDYVLAARSAGFGAPRIIVRHLLPNVITQAIVFATADVVLDILAIVTLGYLGLGVPPPIPDWGRMIFNGQQFLTTQWQLATFPGLAVVVTGIGLALLGDGLSDLLRPE
jgi:peptide/nickel transport system permease protein